MNLFVLRCLVVIVCSLGGFATAPAAEQVRVLIIDGRNNHDWRRTTQWLRAALEATGRFDVSVSTTPESYSVPAPRLGKELSDGARQAYVEEHAKWTERNERYEQQLTPQWTAWRPEFTKYQVVVNNYNGLSWPEEVKASLVEFVRGGGGVVNVHAANNAFSEWAEFDEMLGIGWRDATHGQRIVFDEKAGVAVKQAEGAEGVVGSRPGHGRVHAFVVTHRQPGHPILRGLPTAWLHGSDELYHGQRGPGKNFTLLATAWSDPLSGGSGQHEPVLWVVNYGQGRVVTTSLGHIWPGSKAVDSVRCVGFQTIFTRSVEWAATNAVTLPVPAAFPSQEHVSLSDSPQTSESPK